MATVLRTDYMADRWASQEAAANTEVARWSVTCDAEMGNTHFELDVLEGAYTPEHWPVRMYTVKDLRT